jgi:hypothetical protein
MRFSGELELHDGIGRRDSVGNFSSIVRYFSPILTKQPNQPECQQAAQLGAAFGGGHLVGRERVRAVHVSVAVFGGVDTDQKPPSRPRRDISAERDE